MAAPCSPSWRVALYVPVNTLIAIKLGGILERLTIAMQQAEGTYRAELTTLLRRSFHVAAARGEDVQKAMHGRLYHRIDRTWTRLNWVNSGYMSFELIYDFLAARMIAYRPAWCPTCTARSTSRAISPGPSW